MKPDEADNLCEQDFRPVNDANHNQTVKPTSLIDPIHRMLRDWLLKTSPDLSRDVTKGGVALLDCEAETYGEPFFVAMEDRLDRLSVAHYRTKVLSVDWDARELPLIWRETEPTVIVAHFSCFQEGDRSRESNEERRKDFDRMLLSLADFSPRVLIYSAALAQPAYVNKGDLFIEQQFQKKVKREFSGDRGLMLWPVVYGSGYSDEDLDCFEALLSGSSHNESCKAP